MTAQDLPKSGLRWFPLNVGSALVIATVVSLLAFMLLSDGEGPVTADDSPMLALADSAELVGGPSSPAVEPAAPVAVSAPTTTIARAETTQESAGLGRGIGGDASMATSIFGGGDTPGLITPVVVAMSESEFGSGPTEVAVVTNFPAIDYTWERIQLEGSGYFDLSWIGELNGTLVAVSSGWNEAGFEFEGGVQTLVTWAESAGSEWGQINSYQLPAETWITRVIGSDDGVYAIGEQMTEEGRSARYIMMTSTDGVSWVTEDLPILRTEGDEYVYLQDAVVGPQGMALLVQYETYPPEPPQVLLFDDYEVVMDHGSGQFTLTELGSGEVVLTGSIEDIYNWNEADGQRIADPATGEELTVVPWDVWEMAYVGAYEGGYGGSPLPIPIDYGASYEAPVIAIEHDGYVITIDEGQGTFTVAAAASGDEIAQGTLEDLYQGPPPQLIDPDTGDVILSVSWDEWYQAEERAWETNESHYEEFEWSSRTAVLTSSDGVAWSEKTLTDGSNGSSGFIAATSDGLTVVLTTYNDLGEQRIVWQMRDGVWSSTPSEQGQLWLYNITDTGDGFLAVGDGSTGQAVWSSPDGISWATEFTAAPQDGGGYVWFNDIASDGNGLVGLIASHESAYEYRPLVIEQDRYTAVFEDGEIVVHITENDSGETVLLLTWEDFDVDPDNSSVTHDGEATLFALGNGDTMRISDADASAAMESRYIDEAPKVGASVFLKEGSSWSEAVVDPGGGFSGASQLYMSDGRIIIAGSYWGGYPYDVETDDDGAVVLIGIPAGN